MQLNIKVWQLLVKHLDHLNNIQPQMILNVYLLTLVSFQTL